MTAPSVERSVRTLGHRLPLVEAGERIGFEWPCVVRDCAGSAFYATTRRAGPSLIVRYVCRRHAESFSKQFGVEIQGGNQ